MSNKKQQKQIDNTLIEISEYKVKGGISEYHIMIHATRPEDTYEQQLNAVINTYFTLLQEELCGAVAVFKRYFLSDAANQEGPVACTYYGKFGLCAFHCGATTAERNKDCVMGLLAGRCADPGSSQRFV